MTINVIGVLSMRRLDDGVEIYIGDRIFIQNLTWDGVQVRAPRHLCPRSTASFDYRWVQGFQSPPTTPLSVGNGTWHSERYLSPPVDSTGNISANVSSQEPNVHRGSRLRPLHSRGPACGCVRSLEVRFGLERYSLDSSGATTGYCRCALLSDPER